MAATPRRCVARGTNGIGRQDKPGSGFKLRRVSHRRSTRSGTAPCECQPATYQQLIDRVERGVEKRRVQLRNDRVRVRPTSRTALGNPPTHHTPQPTPSMPHRLQAAAEPSGSAAAPATSQPPQLPTIATRMQARQRTSSSWAKSSGPAVEPRALTVPLPNAAAALAPAPAPLLTRTATAKDNGTIKTS